MVGKITKWSYLEPLLFSDEYIHLKEISRQLDKNHSVVRQYLNYFEKEGILRKKKQGRLTLYKINSSHPLIIDYLSIAEKEKLLERCRENLIINEVVSFLHKNIQNNNVLIFGSTVNKKKPNDIDILITDEFKENKIKEFEKKHNIEIHLINVENLENIKESLKKEIKSKHLLVSGTEEIIRWLI